MVEWETVFPVIVFLPVITQTLAISLTFTRGEGKKKLRKTHGQTNILEITNGVFK